MRLADDILESEGQYFFLEEANSNPFALRFRATRMLERTVSSFERQGLQEDILIGRECFKATLRNREIYVPNRQSSKNLEGL